MLALLLTLSLALPASGARVRGEISHHGVGFGNPNGEDDFSNASDTATVNSDDFRNLSDFEMTPNCVVDIMMLVNNREFRIPALKYRGKEVYALTKTLVDGQVASYYIGCRHGFGTPMTYIRVKKSCVERGCYGWGGKKWATEEVRQFWFDKTRNAVSIEDKESIRTIALNPEFLVPSFPGKFLNTDIALQPWRFNTCDLMPHDGCYAGCCGQGLMCVERFNGTGSCVPRSFDWYEVCQDVYNERCRRLIREWSNLEEWALVLASSGGGGHIAAAKNLVAKWSKDWNVRVAQYKESFKRNGEGLVRDVAHKEMARALKHAEKRGPPITQLDIMETPCFDVFGINMGGFAKNQWDKAQLAGDLKKLRELIDQQWLTPWVFGLQCKNYFAKVLGGNQLPFQGSPTEVISTQPLLLHSISKAMQTMEGILSKKFRLDVYMTDLPTEASVHFFDALRKGVSWNKEASKHIYLHSVPPVDENPRNRLATLAGLPEDQIIIEDFMPVNMEFTNPSGNMPRPGMDAKLALKAQNEDESGFLSDMTHSEVKVGQKTSITVGAADRLLLVMLGSQPTVSAMREYLQTSLNLPETSGLNWVFLACGKPSIPDYASLYEASIKLAAEFNAKARASGRHLQIVPFTGQPAQHVLSRADATLTRSGGLTSGELLALAVRGDSRDVLLHVEVQPGLAPEPPSGGPEDAQVQTWQSLVLEGGMVPWEAGNARHLMGAVDARIVTSEMDFNKLLSF